MEDVEAPINGDILEAILSRVPLIDLVSASHVSKSWQRAVLSSLRHYKKVKPWLVVRTQTTRPPYKTTTHAYDPRSDVWIKIDQPSSKYESSLIRSSSSNLVFTLSPSKLSFSVDALSLTWHHVDPPLVWRTDPVVAVVGHHVVVAGGTCDLEDDPLAVEIYDMTTQKWETCESMPTVFKNSTSSMWLSVAVNSQEMYLAEKMTGTIYRFNPGSTKTWLGPFDPRPDQNIYNFVICFANDRLILVGLLGDTDNLKAVKVWEVSGDLLENCREIGEMPGLMVEKLRGESFWESSLAVTSTGGCVCIYNPSNPQDLVFWEIGDDRWRAVENVAVDDGSLIMNRFVFTYCNAGLGDLDRAIRVENWKFEVEREA